MIKDRSNRNHVPQSSELEVITTKDYGLSKNTYIGNAEVLTDKNGDIIPQIYDDDLKEFVPLYVSHFSFEEGE